MSGSDGMTGPPASTFTDPDASHAAGQVVLRRALAQQWTRREVLDVMEALGLVGYEDGARVDTLGARRPLTAKQQRAREDGEVDW